MISMSTNTEWRDNMCELCWAQSLWLKLTAQYSATGTSPVCFCNLPSAGASLDSSLAFSGFTGNVCSTNQWLIEAVEWVHTGNQYVPGCTAQDGIYWMRQWFDADLLLVWLLRMMSGLCCHGDSVHQTTSWSTRRDREICVTVVYGNHSEKCVFCSMTENPIRGIIIVVLY